MRPPLHVGVVAIEKGAFVPPPTYHYLFSFESFSHQRELMVSHWSLSDNKFPQVSRTFLSILADLVNAVMVSVFLLISKSSSNNKHGQEDYYYHSYSFKSFSHQR